MLYVVIRTRGEIFAEYAVVARSEKAAIRGIQEMYGHIDGLMSPKPSYRAIHFPKGRVILRSNA